MQRRSLLKLLLAGGGVAALGGIAPLLQLATASESSLKPRYFIFVYFTGAWDVLLSLDPRDPTYFNEESMAKTLILPGYELQVNVPATGYLPFQAGNLYLGPYIGELSRHAQRLAIVRGMSMDTLTHEVGRRRFLTGKPPSGLSARGSSVATWLAALLGKENLIPNLSSNVEAYNVDQDQYASALKVASVNDLLRTLRPAADVMPDLMDRQVQALHEELACCDSAQKSALYRQAEASRQTSVEMIESNKASLFDFQANTTEMNALRAKYGFPTTGTNIMGSPEAQAAMAAQAICGGLARCVSITANVTSLDHHFIEWTTDQGPTQARGFTAVARLVDDLASRAHPDGGTWLDYTTILGFSEFSRTALLNASTGRDHSLCNACFLLGAGIKGNQVIGRSSDVGMAPYGVDLETGAPKSDGDLIRPENILRTLFHVGGIQDDVADLRVEPVYALLS